MNNTKGRRRFLQAMITVPAATLTGTILNTGPAFAGDPDIRFSDSRLKTSLNAYSFNELLENGSFNLEQLLDFASDHVIDAVDLTAYYFPDYPQVPPDDFLYDLKREAFVRGVEISGTGIRNNFTEADEEKRKMDIELIKNWIVAAEKMGAPVIRIFAGQPADENISREKILDRMAPDIRQCVDFGKQHGVVVGIQNHNDFIKTPEHALQVLDKIKSDWFGLILDTGSYRSGDPYRQIEQTARHAVNWQVKEKVYIDGKEETVNLKKLIGIIRSSGYRGYLPIETLPPRDPRIAVPELLKKLKKAIGYG